MQSVTQFYLDGMSAPIRRPSHMRLTFHYPTGDVVYTDADIVKVTEKKQAHLVAGELPTIELTAQLLNLDGSFDPNDVSGLHDMIVKGVLIGYEFGFDIPLVRPYGYEGEPEETYDPVYGIRDTDPPPQFTYITGDGVEVITAEAYGYSDGHLIEWFDGGEVYTDGDLSYDPTSVTITAYDYLSFLTSPVYFTHGERTLAQIAQAIIDETDYPEDESGNKKIKLGAELSAFSTNLEISYNSDTAKPAKEWLQTIAHAGGVKMYIDRAGYLCMDNEPELLSASQYHLTLDQQKENPKHSKKQMPKSLSIKLNSQYGDPILTTLTGGGEEMTVENEYIVTTAEGEALRDRLLDDFLVYRNEGSVSYRGEPALDILDPILLDTDFADNITAIITAMELVFDGTLSGALTLRYQLGETVPYEVRITGGGNFIYPVGGATPSPASITLVCDTDISTPTYQWYVFLLSTGAWQEITGATTDTLAIDYSSSYFANDDAIKLKCVVNGEKAALTTISKIQLVKSETAAYRGAVVGTSTADIETDIPSPQIGDVVLLNNTADEEAVTYGETYAYNGEEWVATEDSDALSLSFKDALQIASDTGKEIYSAVIYTNLLVANEAFIDILKARNIQAGSGDGTSASGFRFRALDRLDLSQPYDASTNPSIFDVYKDDKRLFSVDISTGKTYFGDHFWYDPTDGAIHTPDDKTVINADGTVTLEGELVASEGELGSLESYFLYKDETGTAYTTSNTFSQVIAFFVSYTGDSKSAAFNATYNGKTYYAFRRKIEPIPRTPSYSPTYYFYATDASVLTVQGTTALSYTMTIFSILSDAEFKSNIEVMGKISAPEIELPIGGNIVFPITQGTTSVVFTRGILYSDAVTNHDEGEKIISSAEGTVTCVISAENSSDDTDISDFILYLVINDDLTWGSTTYNYGVISANNTESLSANLTIHPNDSISLYRTQSDAVPVIVTIEMKCNASFISNAAKTLAFVNA